MNTQPRIIFFGNSEFSAIHFRGIGKLFPVQAVITSPDQKQGRGYRIAEPMLKTIASLNHVPVYQPTTLQSQMATNLIRSLKPDLGIVVAYGKMIPPIILEIPPFGMINVHPSLLPILRGPSPIQSAILNGFFETGISIMKINERMDEGPIFQQEIVRILPNDTSKSLEDRISGISVKLLCSILPSILSRSLTPFSQTGQPTYCHKITKKSSRIIWTESGDVIERKIRAFNPLPIAWTVWESEDKIIKIHKASLAESSDLPIAPGSVFFDPKQTLCVQCGNQRAIKILTMQMEGKKPVSIQNFVSGYPKIKNARFL